MAFIVSGVVYAQSNERKPEPGDYLNATQLKDFKALRTDVKNGLEDGFLVDLASQTALTEEDKKNFFAAVVEMEKKAPAVGEHVHARDETSRHSHCSRPANVTFSVGSRVGAFSSAACVRTIRSFHSWSKIFSNPGYSYSGRRFENATYTSSWTYADYRANNKYKYCGGFWAHVLDEPTPVPTRNEICYWYET